MGCSCPRASPGRLSRSTSKRRGRATFLPG
jgi:hypothetical protein